MLLQNWTYSASLTVHRQAPSPPYPLKYLITTAILTRYFYDLNFVKVILIRDEA
jgi:hypothetical protein